MRRMAKVEIYDGIMYINFTSDWAWGAPLTAVQSLNFMWNHIYCDPMILAIALWSEIEINANDP